MTLPTLSQFDAELALHLWYGRKLDTRDIARWLNRQKPQPNQYVGAITESAVYNSLSNLRAARLRRIENTVADPSPPCRRRDAPSAPHPAASRRQPSSDGAA